LANQQLTFQNFGGFFMLSTLRDKKTMHVILWGLVIAFVATIFIAWGAGSTLQKNSADPNVIAKVGSQDITYADFNRIYQPELDRLYNVQGEAPTSDQLTNLKKHVLDSLIDNTIMSQTAQKLGIVISDEELASILQNEPYFKDQNGKFSKEKYAQVLQANQITAAQFEASERSEMLLQKIRSTLSDAVVYTPDELADYKNLLNRDIKVEYITLNPKDYEKAVVAKDEDLKDFYENHKTEFDRPERVKVRHILLASQASANPLEGDKSEKTLEDYRNQVLSGKATFASLAEKYSADTGSKKQGGDLGWVTRGEMVKEFEDAVFAAKKGEITKPFKTKFGYHIAQVVDVEKEYKSTFSGVRAKVLEQYKKTKANQATLAVASQLSDKVKNKEKIETVAKELGLKETSSLWFSQNQDVTGLKDSKQFSRELVNLYPGDWAGPYPIGGKEYFFQVTDARPGKDSVKDSENSDIGRRFMASRQDIWLKDFLDQQKKTLQIKTFLNS
jgi:peptidyl-prolyl cis-trans isomerase D